MPTPCLGGLAVQVLSANCMGPCPGTVAGLGAQDASAYVADKAGAVMVIVMDFMPVAAWRCLSREHAIGQFLAEHHRVKQPGETRRKKERLWKCCIHGWRGSRGRLRSNRPHQLFPQGGLPRQASRDSGHASAMAWRSSGPSAPRVEAGRKVGRDREALV